MKHTWILLLTILLSTTCLADRKDQFSLGKLSLGQKASRVVRVLGQPTEKSEATEEMATGEMVQKWSYPEQGLELDLSRTEDSKPYTVYRIYAKEPCKMSSYRGINIGSFAVEVRAVVRSHKGSKGVEINLEEQACSLLWLDSYQLLFVTFSKDKVSEIYLGPGPE